MSQTNPQGEEAPKSFEAALAELEKIVQAMESSSLTLEQSLAAHRRGLDLAKLDRKSTRLNSSHLGISYAVFCLKKKKTQTIAKRRQERAIASQAVRQPRPSTPQLRRALSRFLTNTTRQRPKRGHLTRRILYPHM